jgi:hypothetical protein
MVFEGGRRLSALGWLDARRTAIGPRHRLLAEGGSYRLIADGGRQRLTAGAGARRPKAERRAGRRPPAVSIALVVVVMVSSSRDLSAQKSVMLQLRPRIGDTISMRLDQQTELASRATDARQAPALASTTSVTYSRAVIESGVASGTTVIAITDSVIVTGASPSKAQAQMARPIAGQRVRLKIAPDGSMTLPSDNPKAPAKSASLIPATFPTTPVAVGDEWMREAALPAGSSQLGATVVGWVKATFRLDSLTRNGDLAWISIDGKLTPDPSGAKVDGVTTVDDGSVQGYMVLDRARGWLTESKFSIVAHSTLRQPFGIASQPVKFDIRLVQSLRTLR